MHYMLSVYLLSYTTTLGKASASNRGRFGLPFRPQALTPPTTDSTVLLTNLNQLRAIFDNYTEYGVMGTSGRGSITSRFLVSEGNPLVMTLKEQIFLISQDSSREQMLTTLKQANAKCKLHTCRLAPPTITAHPYGRLSLDQLKVFSKHFQLCPHIINPEELSSIYRYLQYVEWMRWVAQTDYHRHGRRRPRYPDLLHQLLEDGSLRMPPSQQSLAISFRYVSLRTLLHVNLVVAPI